MNHDIFINTNQMDKCISDYNTIVNDMSSIFASIKEETEALKDVWSTKTSEEIYNEFGQLYGSLSDIIDKNIEHISYLKYVCTKYTEKEHDISNKIDTNIRVQGDLL